MSIIETHLFSQYVSCGIPGKAASLTLTVYGITTMLGSVLTGFPGQRFPMKNVLASVYGVRILIVLGFLLLPKSVPFAFAWLGGVLINTSLGYSALWLVDLCLCVAAAVASFRIKR